MAEGKGDGEAARKVIEFFRDAWRNAGTICHLCGQPGMKQLGETECKPHDCPHGRPCKRAPLAPEGHTTSCCAECNAVPRLGDVLAEAMRRREGR